MPAQPGGALWRPAFIFLKPSALSYGYKLHKRGSLDSLPAPRSPRSLGNHWASGWAIPVASRRQGCFWAFSPRLDGCQDSWGSVGRLGCLTDGRHSAATLAMPARLNAGLAGPFGCARACATPQPAKALVGPSTGLGGPSGGHCRGPSTSLPAPQRRSALPPQLEDLREA